MFSDRFLDRIATKRGKALYAIACGEHLTKLEVKERAALSMSTVISAVDSLRQAGLVTVGERRVASGGKPHSVIDVATGKCVYGVSFRDGKLFAAALDLRGGPIARRSMTPSEGVSPVLAVSTILSRLSDDAPSPLALALAVNSPARGEMIARLSEEYGTEVICLTNTEALAYRALWRGACYPLAVIGFGSRIKCAFSDGRSSRVVDLGGLTLSPVFAAEGEGIGALLSAPRVERTLREKAFGGYYSVEGGELRECRDLSDYSAILLRAVCGVVEAVDALSAPREIRLFGDCVTAGFFDRIRSHFPHLSIVREEADGAELAESAAIAALTEGVFS